VIESVQGRYKKDRAENLGGKIMQGRPIGKGSWVHFSGEIISGKGEGSRFVQLPWVREQIVNKIGFAPYPGTFNIKISDYAGREAAE